MKSDGVLERKNHMRTALILCVLWMALPACNEEEENIQLDESSLSGTFVRLSPDSEGVESPVLLNLSNGQYTGQADSLYYPAICEGTYSIEGRRITFTNECGWTANFDWTYILQGTYIVEENHNETVLIQEVGENIYNIYRLR